MNAAPLISAIIPTRDRAELLRQALASLSTQTLTHGDFEVVVIDDGSDDRTRGVCSEIAGDLPLTYHRIAASGISAAKNLGIFASSAPIVFFFDDDDIADPDLLRQHVVTHQSNPDVATAVLGRTEWSPTLRVSALMHYLTDVGKFLFDYTAIAHGDVVDFTYFWGGRSSCKRILLAREGIFNQDFRFGSEDIELGYRLRSRGFKVVYNRDALSLMNREVTYEEFCARCERQGRSQHYFGNILHRHDPDVRRYCDVDDAEARWRAAEPLLAQQTSRIRELEQRVAVGGDRESTRHAEAELYQLYGETFRAHKLKGIVMAASGA